MGVLAKGTPGFGVLMHGVLLVGAPLGAGALTGVVSTGWAGPALALLEAAAPGCFLGRPVRGFLGGATRGTSFAGVVGTVSSSTDSFIRSAWYTGLVSRFSSLTRLTPGGTSPFSGLLAFSGGWISGSNSLLTVLLVWDAAASPMISSKDSLTDVVVSSS